ncbi:4576_t:CDS:1, partial [Paraglomus brasilianum]
MNIHHQIYQDEDSIDAFSPPAAQSDVDLTDQLAHDDIQEQQFTLNSKAVLLTNVSYDIIRDLYDTKPQTVTNLPEAAEQPFGVASPQSQEDSPNGKSKVKKLPRSPNAFILYGAKKFAELEYVSQQTDVGHLFRPNKPCTVAGTRLNSDRQVLGEIQKLIEWDEENLVSNKPRIDLQACCKPLTGKYRRLVTNAIQKLKRRSRDERIKSLAPRPNKPCIVAETSLNPDLQVGHKPLSAKQSTKSRKKYFSRTSSD